MLFCVQMNRNLSLPRPNEDNFDKMLINQCFGALVDEKTNAK